MSERERESKYEFIRKSESELTRSCESGVTRENVLRSILLLVAITCPHHDFVLGVLQCRHSDGLEAVLGGLHGCLVHQIVQLRSCGVIYRAHRVRVNRVTRVQGLIGLLGYKGY